MVFLRSGLQVDKFDNYSDQRKGSQKVTPEFTYGADQPDSGRDISQAKVKVPVGLELDFLQFLRRKINWPGGRQADTGAVRQDIERSKIAF